MRIAVVGGIFGKPAAYRRIHQSTPETILAERLGARGHAVRVFGHLERLSGTEFDIVHVHHLSYGAVFAATDPSSARLVFTPHRSTLPGGARAHALRLAVDRSDAVVALSRTEAEWHLDSLGVPEDRSRVIPNGADPFAFPFAERRAPTVGPWRLLFVGQLQPLKGVDVLLRAVALLADEEDVVLDLVYHVDAAEPELLRRRAKLGLESRVRFLGPRSQKSLAREYQRASMLVLPSLEEQLPSVVTEAMLSGCPVVASDVGSVREQLNRTGVVVPRGDPGALAAGIRAVLREYERYCDGAARARESALRRFSVGAMVDAHERLYQELLQSDVPVRRHIGGPSFRAQLWKGATAAWITLKCS